MTESCPTCLHRTLDQFEESNLFLCGNCDALFKADSLDVSQSTEPDTNTDTLESGIVTLAKDPKEDFPEDAPWAVSGVALPVNQKVRGGQGVDHYYPESVLEQSAELLEGQPIVSGYHQIDGMPDPEHVVGEVTDAAYQDGVGLVYSGEIIDADVADKISQEYLSVSPTVARELGEFDESKGAQRVERVGGFRDLAIVVSGQPGAEISMGSNPAATGLSNPRIEDGFEALDPPETSDKPSFVSTDSKEEQLREQALDAMGRRDGLEDYTKQERAKLSTNSKTTMTDDTTEAIPVDTLRDKYNLATLTNDRKLQAEIDLLKKKVTALKDRTPEYADELETELETLEALKGATASSWDAIGRELSSSEHVTTMGNATSSTLDSLSAEQKEKIETKLWKADRLEGRTPDYADTLRSEAAEIAGVNSHEEIEVDAL